MIYLWLGWRAGWLAPPTWQSHGVKIKHTHCHHQPNMKVKKAAIQSPKGEDKKGKQNEQKTKQKKEQKKERKKDQIPHTH